MAGTGQMVGRKMVAVVDLKVPVCKIGIVVSTLWSLVESLGGGV